MTDIQRIASIVLERRGAEVYTSSGVLYVMTPETFAQLNDFSSWHELVAENKLEEAHNLVLEYGGEVLREPHAGLYSVDTVAKWAARTAAQVGTDTATIWAISPEQLEHFIEDENPWAPSRRSRSGTFHSLVVYKA